MLDEYIMSNSVQFHQNSSADVGNRRLLNLIFSKICAHFRNIEISILVPDRGSSTIKIYSRIKNRSRMLYEFSPGGNKVDGLPPFPSLDGAPIAGDRST